MLFTECTYPTENMLILHQGRIYTGAVPDCFSSNFRKFESQSSVTLSQSNSCLCWGILFTASSSFREPVSLKRLPSFDLIDFEMRDPTPVKSRTNSSVSQQDTPGGAMAFSYSHSSSLRSVLTWRVSRAPESFKGLKSNFSPCNPGAFQTSHAVYWHMTKKFNPPLISLLTRL